LYSPVHRQADRQMDRLVEAIALPLWQRQSTLRKVIIGSRQGAVKWLGG